MLVAGVPVWSLVLVACVAGPLLVRAWVEAELRAARERTSRVLGSLPRRTPLEPLGADRASTPTATAPPDA
jgi:hypothetical protein